MRRHEPATQTRPLFPARFNLAAHLLDARVDEGSGGRGAITTADETITYAGVQAAANRVANVLAEAGIRPGDRVLITLPDVPAFPAALFGALKVGAVVAMANPDIPVEDHAHLLGYTGARALVTSGAVAARAAEVVRGAEALALCLVDGADGAGFTSLARRCDAASPRFDTVATHRDDVALWLFTSGSTGRPRAALHRHQDFAHHIECYAKGVLGLGPEDVTLAVPRLYFPYATGMNLLFPFAVGARAVLFPEHPTAARLLDLIERFRPTVFTTVPTMTAKMLAEPGAAARDLRSLRLSVSAGEALPPDLYRRWKETFGVEMLDGIGSAEMFHIYISNRPGDVRPGSLGRPVPGYRARVMRADGVECDEGEVGTLWVTGGSVFLGYHQDPERTAAVLREEVSPEGVTRWVISGDFFRYEDGYYHYAGRADDMLKVGGIYVSPLEVENVLREHPAVAECAVVGYEDEHGLVKPRAFVVPSAGLDGDGKGAAALFEELAAFARGRLARYKVPRSWIAREALPRNDRGKIVRRDLRQPGDPSRG